MGKTTISTWTCEFCGGVDTKEGTGLIAGWSELRISDWPNETYREYLVACYSCAARPNFRERFKHWWSKSRLERIEWVKHWERAEESNEQLKAQLTEAVRTCNWIVNNACSWGLESEPYVTRARECLEKLK